MWNFSISILTPIFVNCKSIFTYQCFWLTYYLCMIYKAIILCRYQCWFSVYKEQLTNLCFDRSKSKHISHQLIYYLKKTNSLQCSPSLIVTLVTFSFSQELYCEKKSWFLVSSCPLFRAPWMLSITCSHS